MHDSIVLDNIQRTVYTKMDKMRGSNKKRISFYLTAHTHTTTTPMGSEGYIYVVNE